MTKIKSYPSDLEVTGSDKWIGTDVGSAGRTKNFTANKVGEYFNKASVVNVANQLRFMYDTIDIGDDRLPGTISFYTELGSTVELSELNGFVLSELTTNGKNIVERLESYVDKTVVIQDAEDPNVFGYYKVTSYTESLTEPGFYDVVLDHMSSNGELEEDRFYFISLLESGSGEDKHYVHTQSIASATWNISHNLEKFPSVSIVLSTGQQGYGDITYINNNNITISFAGAESGKAYIN